MNCAGLLYPARLTSSVAKENAVAFPTFINDQITDSITQANTKVLGDAPAIVMGNLFEATAQVLAKAAHNAAGARLQSPVAAQAATAMGVAVLYAVDDMREVPSS